MAKPKKPSPKELYWARKHKEEAEKAALLPPGLVNHGNTCFMNSVLQGLIATNLLEELVLFRPPTQRFVQASASRRSPLIANGRGPEGVQKDWVRGMAIGDVFLATLERAWRKREAKDRSSISPKELLGRLGQKYDQYLDFRQQDAHEFFLHLLDGMRMEEFDIIKIRQPRPSRKSSKRRASDVIVGHDVPDAIPEKDRLVSFVDLLWGGKFTSVLICETCKHVSHTYEDFDDLSLSITHDESKERKRDRLRAFAAKFMSQPNRSRGQGVPRPQSASQPPSPSLPTTSLEPTEEDPEPPRRRSLEASSLRDPSPEPSAERRKVDILAGFRNSDDILRDPATQHSGLLLQKVNDAGLGRLGRRISVGMSLGTRKEKKPGRTDKERKVSRTQLNGKSSEPDEDGKSFSPASSKPTSRQPSPGPTKKPKGFTNPPKPSAQDKREAAYLRRLLEDTTPNSSNPLAMLRMSHSNSSSSSSTWSRNISSTQGVEDCLRMFTAVEALDGDNMFGCRNCWKIANGQAPRKPSQPLAEENSDDSSDADEERQLDLRPSGSAPVDPMPSSAISLPHVLSEDHSTSSVSASLMSSTLELSTGRPASTASTSATSLSTRLRTRNLMGLALQDEKLSTHSTKDETTSRDFLIPTIATISPPPDGSTPDSLQSSAPYGTLSRTVISSRDSLRLPEVRYRHRPDNRRDGESSVSSDESGHDDTSGISDGDASVASASQSVDTRRPRRSSLPRSKQIIYRRALKRYLIARPPPILVIHLKRFQQVSKSPLTLFGNLKKLDDYVSFPEFLDIRPFLAPKKEDYGLGKGELRGNVVEKGKREEDQPCVYRLYSVVVHIGNMLGGHYVAYTALPPSKELPPSPSNNDPAYRERRPATAQSIPETDQNSEASRQERQWCYISDTVVRLVSLEEVLKAKAYLCMYERMQ
ncbi:hypothetical protein JB92DRAFT_796461 [Gautieria morchelliformis]|nr:hypothetical protein JB92DRAFT_796461 [Gautieria morchelliformis]